jgi:hypothetical protein
MGGASDGWSIRWVEHPMGGASDGWSIRWVEHPMGGASDGSWHNVLIPFGSADGPAAPTDGWQDSTRVRVA